MKCPKCGYTSFAYLERCSKCGQELAEVRAPFGLYALPPTPLDLTAPLGPGPEVAAIASADATFSPIPAPRQSDSIERVFDLEIEDDAGSLTLESATEASADDPREPAGPVLDVVDEIEMHEWEREDDDAHR